MTEKRSVLSGARERTKGGLGDDTGFQTAPAVCRHKKKRMRESSDKEFSEKAAKYDYRRSFSRENPLRRDRSGRNRPGRAQLFPRSCRTGIFEEDHNPSKEAYPCQPTKRSSFWTSAASIPS